ncbi:MAG: glycosyltransferase [Rhodobacteraceae bacterium]|nr:MAG: glycosyltransferase [Paracoccaceae bacterium]
MRVLHYNWADPDDTAGRGGGVRHYMQGLIRALAQRPGCRVNTLSSGLAHDLRARAPRWRHVRDAHFEIVNARPLAPSQADFASPAQISHPPTEAAFRDFLRQTGPYDIVHFHTLEGLPAQVLEIAAEHARVAFSLHNYHTLCAQVNLWRQERTHCRDFANGQHCRTCLPLMPDPRAVRRAYQLETCLARLGPGPGRWACDRVLRPLLRRGWRMARRLARRRGDAAAPPALLDHAQRRARIVGLVNAHCARVLAVSERTRAIALAHGMARVQTLYIGTDQARKWARSTPRKWPARFTAERPLRLTYLGYMRRDKGFAFLLGALADLPMPLAQRIHLTVAAHQGDARMMAQMDALRGHLAGLRWCDGYTHSGLDVLLADTDLGVVPPLWQDNLPQTALEMHARHIPILTSDRGGASELGGSDALVFRAGDSAGFAARLAQVLDGQVCLQRYWAQARAPQDMARHADALAHHYTTMLQEGEDESADPYRHSEIGDIVDPGVSRRQSRRAV